MSTPSREAATDKSTVDSPDSTTNGKIEDPSGDEGEAAAVEEEGECGFCLFMKAGGCKDSFVAWDKCVKAVEEGEDMVSKCAEKTMLLQMCMEAYSEFYEPVLRAGKEAVKQLEKEAGEAAMDKNEKLEAVESGHESGAGSSKINEETK